LLEADYLTLHFAHYPIDMYTRHIHQVIVNSTTTEANDGVGHAIALLKLFMPRFVQQCGHDPISQASLCVMYTEAYGTNWDLQDEAPEDVTREVMLLRTRLYRRPRVVAFTSGMHSKLGSGSQVRFLSDDLCKRILELSFAE
jgi:hypothetical protein